MARKSSGPEATPAPQPEAFDPGAAFAERMAALRAARGWSYDELAARSGVTFAALQKVEVGLRADARISTVVKVARAFGVGVSDLVDPTPRDGAIPPSAAALIEAAALLIQRAAAMTPGMSPAAADLQATAKEVEALIASLAARQAGPAGDPKPPGPKRSPRKR